jgi:hypothetical protein
MSPSPKAAVSRKRFSWLIILVCVVVWFLGEAALGGGISGVDSHGLLIAVFAGACALLWAAARFSAGNSTVSTVVFVVIGLWALKLGIALFADFRGSISSGVFWSFAAVLAILVIALGLAGQRAKDATQL